MFGPSKWEIDALVIVSAQLHSIQRKLDTLLAGSGIPPEQLAELARESASLRTKSEALAAAIEKQTEKG